MKVKNGQYLVVSGDGTVLKYLSNDHGDAIHHMYEHYRNNSAKRPDAYLVQVQAMLEYPPPNITTIAHEVMK